MPKSTFLKELGIASTPNLDGGFQDVDEHYKIEKPEWEIVHAIAVLLGTLKFNANNCFLMQTTLCPEIEHGDYTVREDRNVIFVLMGANPATIESMSGCEKRRFLVDAVRKVLANEYGQQNEHQLKSFDDIIQKHWEEKSLRFSVFEKSTKTYSIDVELDYSWQENGTRSYVLNYSEEKRGLNKSMHVPLHSVIHLEHLLGSVVRKDGKIIIKPKLSGYDLFRRTQLYELPKVISIEDMTDR